MSAQEQLFNKFKEAFETKNLDSLDPFLTEGMTYETLPPSSVIIVQMSLVSPFRKLTSGCCDSESEKK